MSILNKKLFIFLFLIGLYALSLIAGDQTEPASIAKKKPFSVMSEVETLDVHYFYGQGCPHCANVEPFLNEMEQRYSLNLHKYDIYSTRSQISLFYEYSDKYGLPPGQRGVPAIFVSGAYFVGDTPILEGFEEVVKEAIVKPPIVKQAEMSKDPTKVQAATSDDGESCESENLNGIDCLSLLALTGAALIDSISPCSIAILICLIGARVLVSNQKKRALKVGLSFCLAVFVAYSFFGLGLLTVLQASGLSHTFSLLVGVIAILAGIFYLKDVFWYGKGCFTTEVPNSLKPLLMKWLKGVTSPIGAFTMGFVVVLFELPCTGGPYLFVLGQLAEASTRLQAVPLLLYYNFIFVSPLIVISLLLYSNLLSIGRAREWSNRNKRLLKIAGGLTMMSMGFLVIPVALILQAARTFLNVYGTVSPPALSIILLYFVVTALKKSNARSRLAGVLGRGMLLISLIVSPLFITMGPSNASAPRPAFVVLETTDTSSWHEARYLIERNGGSVLHVYPPNVLIGYLTPALAGDLIGRGGIERIFFESIDPSAIGKFGSTALFAATAFNRNFMGLDRSEKESSSPGPIVGDMMPSPKGAMLEGGLSSSAVRDPQQYETSLFMIGDTSVAIIIMESNGVIDPNSEDWNTARMDNVVSKIQGGLNWWISQESRAKLTWIYHVYYQIPTGYEPIIRSSSDDDLWINDAMDYFDVPGSYAYSRVRTFDDSLRKADGTDWAFTVFVVDSLNDPDGKFSNGYFGYAYLGGPYFVMTYDNDGWGISRMDKVAAHETGHIFKAGDEYCQPGYACCSCGNYGFLNVPNSQCEAGCYPGYEGSCGGCYTSNCLMDDVSWCLTTPTRYQLGWRDLDNDNILDAIDSSYNSWGDIDGDGIVDYFDDCPTDAGAISNDGCISTCHMPIKTNTTLTFDISCSETTMVVKRDNIVLDCDSHSLTGSGTGKGIDLTGRSGVTIKHCDISSYSSGIYLTAGATNNIISWNNVIDNDYNLYNDQPNSVKAELNWWGESICRFVDPNIYDNEEGKGEVDFDPVLDDYYPIGSPRVCDYSIPLWQNQRQSNSTPSLLDTIYLSVEAFDNQGLDWAVLSTNETGVWQNKTFLDMGDVANEWVVANFSWSNPTLEIGTVVSWKFYLNDTSANEAMTDVFSFFVQSPETIPPYWKDQGQNRSILLKEFANSLYAEARDDSGLSHAWLSTNETGVWQNKTSLALPTLNDSSTAKNLTFTTSENKTAYISIPKNANVTAAKLNLSGYGYSSSVGYSGHPDDDHRIVIVGDKYDCGGPLEPSYFLHIDLPSNIYITSWEIQIRETRNNPGDLIGKLEVCPTSATSLSNSRTGIESQCNEPFTMVNNSYTISSLGTWTIEFSSPYYSNSNLILKTYSNYDCDWHMDAAGIGSIQTSAGTVYQYGFDSYTLTDNVALEKKFFGTLHYTKYPTNPYLDVGGDGDIELSYLGEFNQTVSPERTSDFSREINDYLSACVPDENGNCDVPLVLHSDTQGKIEISDIRIVYNHNQHSVLNLNNSTNWKWSVFTWKNASITTDMTVAWRIYYNDTYGNVAATDIMTFRVVAEDSVSPSWRNQGQNKDSILPTEEISLYAQVLDDVGLDYVWLATNETGIWQNKTFLVVNSLNDSSTVKNLIFYGNQNKTVYITLPKSAEIRDARLNVSGLAVEMWESNSTVANGLTCCDSRCNVDLYDIDSNGTMDAVVMGSNGCERGFTWNGSYWNRNDALVAGMGGTQYYSNVELCDIRSDGLVDAIIMGFRDQGQVQTWNGTYWNGNGTLSQGLYGWSHYNFGESFVMDGALHLFHGQGDMIIPSGCYGNLNAFTWNGTYWTLNSSIMSGINTSGCFIKAGVYHNQIDSTYRLFLEKSTNTMVGSYYWNGTRWIPTTEGESIPAGSAANKPNFSELPKYNVILVMGYSSGYIIKNSNQFPTNPYLDVLQDGDLEWLYSTEFNESVSPRRTSDFSQQLNNYLMSCVPDQNGYCDVPLLLHSDTSGIVQISDVRIVCNYLYFITLDMMDAIEWTWSNFTWTNTSIPVGTTVAWRIYHNDTAGNEAATDVMTFDIRSDNDGDQVPVESDNCPDTFNPDQVDSDVDGVGDICDICPLDPTDSCDSQEAASCTVSETGGNITTESGSAKLEIPPGALTNDTSLFISGTNDTAQFDKSQTETGLVSTGFIYSFGLEGTVFNLPVQITLKYNESGIIEDTVDIYYYNPKTDIWEKQNALRNADLNECYLNVTHFSNYTTGGRKTAPPLSYITIISPQNGTHYKRPVLLDFTIMGDTSWIVYSLDNQPNITITEAVYLTNLSDGLHHVIIYASDTYGYVGTSDRVYFTVDSVPPEITILSPQNTTYFSVWGALPLTFEINEPTSWIGYSLDNQSNKTIGGNTTIVIADGTHNLIVWAGDYAGNIGSSQIVYFTMNSSTDLWELSFTGLGGYPVVDFVIYNGSIYAAADNKLYVYDGSSWSIIDAPTFVISLAPFEDKLVVGGQGGLYSFNGTDFILIFSVPNYINPLGVYNSILYAGTLLDNSPTLHYCDGSCENPGNWYADTGFSTMLNFSGPFGSIDSFTVYNNKMYVSSGSTIYCYNGTAWSIVNTYDDVSAFLDMQIYDGKLYSATRDQACRKPIYEGYSGFSGRVIEFDGNNWTTVFDHDYWIYSLETYSDKLYAGTANKIFAYNGTHWETSFSSEEGAYYAVSLITYDGKIYAGMGNGYIFVDPSPETLQREMVVVPEFPVAFIMPILMMLTLFATVFIKKKKARS